MSKDVASLASKQGGVNETTVQRIPAHWKRQSKGGLEEFGLHAIHEEWNVFCTADEMGTVSQWHVPFGDGQDTSGNEKKGEPA